MSGNPVIERLGRRLRLGVVGGGGESMIGPVHRAAAVLDGRFEIVASVLSSDGEKSLAEGRALGIPRPYRDLGTMLVEEGRRDDRIDAVAIMTPNDSHFDIASAALDDGLHVICDKPLTNTREEAFALADRVQASRKVFCLTHNYSGYPMVREARARVAAGEIGEVRLAHVAYAQGQLARRVEDGEIPARLRWRLDPVRGGVSHVMGDIGTHAHQLLTFVAGRQVERVLADVGAVVPDRRAHDTASVLMRLEGGARGVLWVTKAASGAENALELKVYGEDGGLEWSQGAPNQLRLVRHDQPARILSRGQPGLSEAARRATRIPAGHPEGFHEAFANLYADFAEAVAATISGRKADPLALQFPTALDGARGIAFVEAAVRASDAGHWVDCL
jgi:predicted dehydrogenase